MLNSSHNKHWLIFQEFVSESYERQALRLIEIEKEFISQLELGVQYYSRPLKHYLISINEHGKLFQNIEKVFLSIWFFCFEQTYSTILGF